MKITTRNEVDVSPDDLAEALVNGGTDAFAKFWFAFAEIAKKQKIDFDALGKSMAPDMGGMRRQPFSAIYHAMQAEMYRIEKLERSGR